jgi:hypothetical protein
MDKHGKKDVNSQGLRGNLKIFELSYFLLKNSFRNWTVC